MRMPRGGGRNYNEDTVRGALYMMAAILVLFFLLVVRLYFDKKAGQPGAELKPMCRIGILSHIKKQ